MIKNLQPPNKILGNSTVSGIESNTSPKYTPIPLNKSFSSVPLRETQI